VTALLAGLTPLVVVVAATVALWHNSLDGQSYFGLLGAVLGLGAGAGIHAAGVKSGSTANSTGTGS
jgi:hypothetical protein